MSEVKQRGHEAGLAKGRGGVDLILELRGIVEFYNFKKSSGISKCL